MALRIALAADHGGFTLKQELGPWLKRQGFVVVDLGAPAYDPSDDYPDFARLVAGELVSGEAQRGIIICGSGVGACIAANKIRGIRACLCHDIYSAHQGVEHDDMNVMCLGARAVGVESAKDLISAFLKAHFSGEERHLRRLEKILAMESGASGTSGRRGRSRACRVPGNRKGSTLR